MIDAWDAEFADAARRAAESSSHWKIHREDVVQDGVLCTAKSGDRPQLLRVDAAVTNDFGANVDADNLAKYDHSDFDSGGNLDRDRRQVAASEINQGGRDTRRLARKPVITQCRIEDHLSRWFAGSSERLSVDTPQWR